MVDTATLAGGAKSALASLTAAEHHAATQALARLDSLDRGGVASVLGGSMGSATLSGGSPHALDTTVVGSGKIGIVAGVGSDTFLGGVSTGMGQFTGTIGTDTVAAGSAGVFASQMHGSDGATADASGQGMSLSNDTINVAGVTAASVKADKPQEAQTSGTTLTLTDKTTVTLIGVSPHDTTKLS